MASASVQRARSKRDGAKSDRLAPVDRGRWGPVLLLVLATLVVLWPVCTHDFTTWDDYQNVAKNPRLNPPTTDGLLYFWTNLSHPYMSIYIPLTYTLWGALAAVGRLDSPDASGVLLNPYLFHAANLLVHLLAVLAAYQLLFVLTKRRWAACAGALLFAVHPVQVEPVAWVAGMKDVLSGLLSLIALWQYVLFAEQNKVDPAAREPATARAPRGYYTVASVAFVLAMLGKPSAMIVPLAALLLDRFILKRSWRAIARAIGPWLVLAVLCAFEAKIAQPVALAPDEGRLWARPLFAGAALAFYLYKLVFPASLAVQYHYSPQVLLAGRWIWFAWLVPAAVALIVWLARKRLPWLVAAAGLIVAGTLPVLGFVPFQFERLSLVADHYLYVSMLGPALALAFVLASIRRTRIAGAACAAALVALAVRSHLQTRHWRDTTTLFTHELAVNPYSEVAYNSLANVAMSAKQPRQAEGLARESIRLQPRQEDAYITLGSALVAEGRPDEALAAYRFATQISPDNPVALSDLAGLLAERGQLEEGIRLCRRAIELDSDSAKAHSNLASMLAHQGQYVRALPEAEIAVQLDPADPQAQTNLGAILLALGQRDAAIRHFAQAVRLDPDSTLARRALADLTGRTN